MWCSSAICVQAAARDAMVRQFEDSMASPGWEPEDWEWRPTLWPSDRYGAGGGCTSRFSLHCSKDGYVVAV